MKQYVYVIQGQPRPAIKVDETNKRYIWDSYREERLLSKINIENQHHQQCATYIDQPLELTAQFFLPRGRHSQNELHAYKPSLINLFNFVDYALLGTVYTKDWNITKIILTKTFDDNPRTEITLREL